MITIISIAHKAIERLMDSKPNAAIKGLDPLAAKKIRRMIGVLEASDHPNELREDHPGWRVHEWPNIKGKFSLDVTGNYRLTFRFDPARKEISDLDLEDPH